MTSNYFDDKGNYINIENLSLKQIYERAFDEGYKKGYIDGALHPANEEGNEATYNDCYVRGRDMNKMAKTIGRIIALLVNRGVITRDKAVWVLDPLKGGET